MRYTLTVAVAVFLASLACGPGVGPSDQLEGYVVVSPGSVALIITHQGGELVCNGWQMPESGSCIQYGEFYQENTNPLDCLDRFSLVREGETLIDALPETNCSVVFEGYRYDPSHSTSLVLEGCGGEWTIDLPEGSPTSVDPTGMSHTSSAITVEWESTDSFDGIYGFAYTDLASYECMLNATSPSTFEYEPGTDGDSIVGLSPVHHSDRIENGLGHFDLFRTGSSSLMGARLPQAGVDGWMGLSIQTESVTLGTDGQERTVQMPMSEWSGTRDGTDLALSGSFQYTDPQGLYGVDLVLETDVEGDEWYLTSWNQALPARTYTATVPHTPPATPLVFGTPGSEPVHMEWGPLTLVSEDDPNDTVEVELTFDGHLAEWTSRPR